MDRRDGNTDRERCGYHERRARADRRSAAACRMRRELRQVRELVHAAPQHASAPEIPLVTSGTPVDVVRQHRLGRFFEPTSVAVA